MEHDLLLSPVKGHDKEAVPKKKDRDTPSQQIDLDQVMNEFGNPSPDKKARLEKTGSG